MQHFDPAKRDEVTGLLADLEAAISHVPPNVDGRLCELLGEAKAAWATGDAAAVSAAAYTIESHSLFKAEAVVSAAGALRRALDNN